MSDYFDMLEQIDKIATSLSDWEVDFVEDVLSRRPKLSVKQKEVIEKLFDTYIVHRGYRT